MKVFGVDNVVHVSFVVGIDAAGGIVLPLSVCDKLRAGNVSVWPRMELSTAAGSSSSSSEAECVRTLY